MAFDYSSTFSFANPSQTVGASIPDPSSRNPSSALAAAASDFSMPTYSNASMDVANAWLNNQITNYKQANGLAPAPAAAAQSGGYAQIPSNYQQYSPVATGAGGMGTNPNLSQPPAVSHLPGGAGIDASGNILPDWGPYGETQTQATLAAQMRSPTFDPNWGAGKPGGNPASIANALLAAQRGSGVGVGGWNPGNEVLQGWLNNPNVQKELPFGYTPPESYQSWLASQPTSGGTTGLESLGYSK